MRTAITDPDALDLTDTAAHWFDWMLGAPLYSAIAVLVGVVAVAVARWLITRTVRSVTAGGGAMRRRARGLLGRTPVGVVLSAGDPLAAARRRQRTETIGSVLRSTAALVIAIVVLTVLANINNWDLGPVLASAGILGVALGFGAQALVKDFLSGLFMLVEDQYGVGDVIDVGEASGVVEAVGLRVTQIRDLSGTLWYVRNGEVLRVGNMTQGWSRAKVEVLVPPESDVDRALELVRAVGTELAEDPSVAELLLAEVEVTGWEDLDGEAVRLRAMVKTIPGQQWAVKRELRARIVHRFRDAGLSLAVPRRDVVVEQTTNPAEADEDA